MRGDCCTACPGSTLQRGSPRFENIFEIRLKTRNWHGQWNPIRLDRTPRDRAGIECDASWDVGAPARRRLRNCLVRLCEMPSTTLLRIFRRFQSPGGEEVYRAAFEKLEEEEEASHLRRGYDGYRTAFETLQQEATQLRQGLDGYRAAFEALSAEVSQVRNELDRVLTTLHKVSRQRRSLPSGLTGRQLCFLHIGKTAGTSVQHALFEALWDAAIFHESLPGFDRVTPAELALNDLVIGHFMYQHVSKMRSARFLMTFLQILSIA
jgi:hypothetical protein